MRKREVGVIGRGVVKWGDIRKGEDREREGCRGGACVQRREGERSPYF